MIFTSGQLLNRKKIIDKIIQNIKNNKGELSFKKFMQINLYDEELGYYYTHDYSKDFITAPIYSKIFSETFATLFAKIIANFKEDIYLIEVGAGNGLFANYCLNKLHNIGCIPKKYYIIEYSNNIINLQKKNLSKNILFKKIEWFNKLPILGKNAIVFVNEVLDSMPVEIFYYNKKNNKFFNVMVGYDNKFFWKYSENIDHNMLKFLYSLPISNYNIDYLFEVNTSILKWLKSIKNMIKKGIIFICDYGYQRNLLYNQDRYMGTLLCYFKHKVYKNPFINIGIQDITTHVDFTLLAKQSKRCKLNIEGFFTQGSFLLNNGIIDCYKENYFIYQKDLVKRMKLSQQIKNLTLGTSFSDQFKVMILTSNFFYKENDYYKKDLKYLL